MLFEDCREVKPPDERPGRARQFRLPPGAIGADQCVPQRAVVGCPSSVVDKRRVECDPLARGIDEAVGILVGTSEKEVVLRGGFQAEPACRSARQQLDRPLRSATSQCKIRCQQVAPGRDLIGNLLLGQLIHEPGCVVRAADVEQNRDGFQHQFLGCRSVRVSRERDVLGRRVRVTSIGDEVERRRLRRAFGRLLYLRALAPGEHDAHDQRCKGRSH